MAEGGTKGIEREGSNHRSTCARMEDGHDTVAGWQGSNGVVVPAVESSEEPGQGGGGPGGSSARRGAAAGKEGSVPFFPLRILRSRSIGLPTIHPLSKLGM